MKRWTAPLLALTFLTFAACGDEGSGDTTDTGAAVEDVPDVEEPDIPKQVTQGSYYSFTITFPTDGVSQKYEQNIDDAPYVISYGSSHIGTAVSLAIEDTLYSPFASINFNFGFVVGSNDYPLTIDDTGRWEWGKGGKNTPPSFKITAKDGGIQRTFASWLPTAEGHYDIERWGNATGDLVKGTLEGTLVNDSGDPLEAKIIGEFQFFLPEKGQ